MVYEQGADLTSTPEFGDQLYGLPLTPSSEVSEELEHGDFAHTSYLNDGYGRKPDLYRFSGHITGLGAAERTDMSDPDMPTYDM